MNESINVSVRREAGGCVVTLLLREPELAGKQARLRVEQHARVKRSSPVHKERLLHECTLTLAEGLNRIELGAVLDETFSYSGSKLDLELRGELRVDDGLVFDTTRRFDLGPGVALPPRRAVPENSAQVHSPRDRFNFFENLRAIPAKARLIVIWLVLIGLPVIVANALVGARDQFVPESQTWFYDHRDSEGDSESPLVKALMGSGGIGMALWLAIRAQLRKYMTFSARLPAGVVRRGRRAQLRHLVSGKPRVALEQAVLRIVAYNREHGQYTKREKSGKSTRTVTRSFTSEGRAMVLLEQALPYVPANVSLADQLEGEVDFTPLFDALYPPFMLDGTHGLSLRLEAQLLHPTFVDQEVELDPGPIVLSDFHPGRET